MFQWDFSGLSFAKVTDHTLLKFGNAGGNGVALNSCNFRLPVNNGYKENDTEDSSRGDPFGVYIVWVLRSKISITGTFAKEIEVKLRFGEFNTISGSCSNTDSNVLTPDGQHQITANRYNFCFVLKH